MSHTVILSEKSRHYITLKITHNNDLFVFLIEVSEALNPAPARILGSLQSLIFRKHIV